jgi:AraC-like DNA-binding protein
MNHTQNRVDIMKLERKREKKTSLFLANHNCAEANNEMNQDNNVVEIDLNIVSSLNCYKRLNKRRLATTLNKLLSLGISDWVKKQRISTAKSLLIHSDLSIPEISTEIGYENHDDFLTDYEKQFNLSPQQQRSLLKIEVISASNTLHM